jgi:hypothetical protein
MTISVDNLITRLKERFPECDWVSILSLAFYANPPSLYTGLVSALEALLE